MNAVPILKEKKTSSLQKGELKFQRCQFPLTLAHALTSYKCQGDSLDEVVVDFAKQQNERRNIHCGSFYVAITRVRERSSLYLKSFQKSYITTNKRVEEKMSNYAEYINTDKNLLNLDFLVLA